MQKQFKMRVTDTHALFHLFRINLHSLKNYYIDWGLLSAPILFAKKES